MDDRERLTQQMSEIGTRYLRRTVGEMDRLQELCAALPQGGAEALKEIEHLAHKMHGTGAMFGFDQVSEAAGELEQFAVPRSTYDGDYLRQLSVLIARLREYVAAAAKARGLT